MADSVAMGTTTILLFMLEDPVGGTDDASSLLASSAMEPVWTLMPQELIETVLLFLPASSQARFRSVCKRWRKLLASSEFLHETTAVALRRGYPSCSIKSQHVGNRELQGLPREEEGEERFKVRKVDFSGLRLPPNFFDSGKVFTGRASAGVPHVLLACPASSVRGELRCWLLNLSKQTWRELPGLNIALTGDEEIVDWKAFLVPQKGCIDFEVFVMHTIEGFQPVFKTEAYLHTLSSTSNDSDCNWRTLGAVHDGPMLMRPHHYASILEWMPGSDFMEPKAQPSSQGRHAKHGGTVLLCHQSFSVFAYGCYGILDQGLFLYKIVEGDWRRWRRLYSRKLPPGVRQARVIWGQVVGNVMLTVVTVDCHRPGMPSESKVWTMAYHMVDGSYKWFQTEFPRLLRSESFCSFVSPFPRWFRTDLLCSFVSPTVLAQVQLPFL